LVRSEIPKSIKGSEGGYILGRPHAAISLANLYSASIDRRDSLVSTRRSFTKPVSPVLAEVQSKSTADLAEILIQLGPANPLNILYEIDRYYTD
jgi:DNA-binding IscR family transcriptional regulator